MTKEEYQKIMLENNYKNFDYEEVVLIAFNMYQFILEHFEKFKEDLGVRYSTSAINQDYVFTMKTEYSKFINRIQNLNKDQLKGFIEEIKIKFPDFEKELTYYNSLVIINYYVLDYENWEKIEKTLFD